uniref:MARVEL domain-containing protein n=1 Tax=Angiostrongylus cantonensis TaxID=6313 RepID=A0A0K0DC69_ANGCA
MVVFESIVTKLQLVISICSVIYSPTWLPVLINFAFLALAIFSLASYAFCWRKRNNLLVLPILIYETVTIFWTMVWLYASITAVATGYLWSLEWIGGPRSDRAAVSYDVNDIRYVDPNESSPETRNGRVQQHRHTMFGFSQCFICVDCIIFQQSNTVPLL